MAASVIDVAAFIAKKEYRSGKVSAKRLYNLLYYCQAWNCHYFREKLFQAHIKTYTHGAYVPQVKRLQEIAMLKASFESKLSPTNQSLVSDVLKKYKSVGMLGFVRKFSPLSELVCSEQPWLESQRHIYKYNRSITASSMLKFYSWHRPNLP